MTTRRLMCVLAHPDDESLGTGGTLAKYAHEGVETYLLTATRGERGWSGTPETNPGLEALGKIREGELRAAATELGVRHLDFLDYIDGDLDQANPAQAIAAIALHIRQAQPQVVVTFGHDGIYGHPDHIAICQFTTAALVAAADPDYGAARDQKPHRVAKLYYMVASVNRITAYQRAFGDLVMMIDDVERRGVGWPDWAVTTRLDTTAYWQQVWRAIECHQTQLPNYQTLKNLPEADHQYLWGNQEYYRAMSLVNGGRQLERDLFEGLP
jgi:LmbE family N-acetylglucosaminyl deacetylase